MNTNTLHQPTPVQAATIKNALTLIDGADLADLLDAAIHATNRRAMPILSPRQILAAWITIALEGGAPNTTNVSNMLAGRLTPKTRQLLGLPDTFATRTHALIAHSVRRQTRNLLDAMDAYPLTERRSRLTKREWDQVLAFRADHASELEDKRHRFLTFANNLLHAQYATLPAELRERASHATIDSRFRPANVTGIPARRVATLGPDDLVSAEPDAGMYMRGMEPRAAARQAQYGWEDELVVLHPAAPGGAPRIVTGFNPHRPGANPARHAGEVLQHLARRGLTLRHVVADRVYMAARPDSLRAALDDLGAKVIGDYPAHRLGVQEVTRNAILVEGTWYDATMPKHLQDAVLDARRADTPALGSGDAETPALDDLIAARAAYALRPNAGGATLPDTTHLEQAIAYGTPEWASAYSTGRNAMEAALNELRRTASLRDGRPGLRGATGHAFLSLLDIIGTNARVVAEWSTREATGDRRSRPRLAFTEKRPAVTLQCPATRSPAGRTTARATPAMTCPAPTPQLVCEH